MTQEKFVVRLLDKEGNLLSWTTVYAAPKPSERGASCPFWPIGPTQFIVERDGVAEEITVHWCDLDIARRKEVGEALPVSVGQVFNFTWLEPVWLVSGMRDVPLPTVTVRAPVAVSVPTGNLASAT